MPVLEFPEWREGSEELWVAARGGAAVDSGWIARSLRLCVALHNLGMFATEGVSWFGGTWHDNPGESFSRRKIIKESSHA